MGCASSQLEGIEPGSQIRVHMKQWQKSLDEKIDGESIADRIEHQIGTVVSKDMLGYTVEFPEPVGKRKVLYKNAMRPEDEIPPSTWKERKQKQAAAKLGKEIKGKAGTVSEVFGKIQFVDNFGDYKVEVVDNFADLKVQKMDNFADSTGKWQIVTTMPDYKIEIVKNFADFKVQYVTNFPGVPESY